MLLNVLACLLNLYTMIYSIKEAANHWQNAMKEGISHVMPSILLACKARIMPSAVKDSNAIKGMTGLISNSATMKGWHVNSNS